jgi:hypothetical protein
MKLDRRLWYPVLIAIGAAIIFQLFFRYSYIHTVGVRVVRVDRLTGTSCELPCNSQAPESEPSGPNQTEIDARIIDYMRTVYSHSPFVTSYPSDTWIISGHYTAAGKMENPFDQGNQSDLEYPVRVVCYCDNKMAGFYYEATYSQFGGTGVMEITGNSVLLQKYGFK